MYCTIPSSSADLNHLNEGGIRHDIALAKEHGFIGTLAIGGVGIPADEYVEFIQIAEDECADALLICHQPDGLEVPKVATG